MKNNIITVILLLFLNQGHSQNNKYEYRGRFNPAIKKESLYTATQLSQIMPEFSRYFSLMHNDRFEFDEQLKLANAPKGYEIYPQDNFYPEKNYEKIIDYVSIEIKAICQGKVITAQSKKKSLTIEQKGIINSADFGTDIRIRITFKFKYPAYDNMDSGIKVGDYRVTVVPETEAEYPGGYVQLTEYLNKNIIHKVVGPNATKKLQKASINFTVNEKGELVNIKMQSTSGDPKTDKLIFNAINEMPKWTPAKNTKGINVQEKFNIPFGGNGC